MLWSATWAWRIATAVLLGHIYFTWATWKLLTNQSTLGLKEAAGLTQSPAGLWYGIAAASVFVYVLVRVLSSTGNVATWNIPEKDRFLRLPPSKQGPVVQIMRSFGAISAIFVILVFWALHAGMLSVAFGVSKKLPGWTTIAITVLTAALLLTLIPWSAAIKSAIEKAERE